MAQLGRPGLLQLLRDTREPSWPSGLSESLAGAVVAKPSSPEPATPPLVDSDDRAARTMDPATMCAPSLSCRSLCRYSSEIRTGCANERPSGSVRGVSREWYPYRDLKTLEKGTEKGRVDP